MGEEGSQQPQRCGSMPAASVRLCRYAVCLVGRLQDPPTSSSARSGDSSARARLMCRSLVPPPDASRPAWCGDHASALTAAVCWRKRHSGGPAPRAPGAQTATVLSLPPLASCALPGAHCARARPGQARRACRLVRCCRDARPPCLALLVCTRSRCCPLARP